MGWRRLPSSVLARVMLVNAVASGTALLQCLKLIKLLSSGHWPLAIGFLRFPASVGCVVFDVVSKTHFWVNPPNCCKRCSFDKLNESSEYMLWRLIFLHLMIFQSRQNFSVSLLFFEAIFLSRSLITSFSPCVIQFFWDLFDYELVVKLKAFNQFRSSCQSFV